MPKKVRVPPGSRNPENDRCHLPRSQSSRSQVETRVSCPEARVRHEKDDSFRTVRCRHCQCIFYLCRRDDRGQCYCSAPCREAGRERKAVGRRDAGISRARMGVRTTRGGRRSTDGKKP